MDATSDQNNGKEVEKKHTVIRIIELSLLLKLFLRIGYITEISILIYSFSAIKQDNRDATFFVIHSFRQHNEYMHLRRIHLLRLI